jgi:hypothetical protein
MPDDEAFVPRLTPRPAPPYRHPWRSSILVSLEPAELLLLIQQLEQEADRAGTAGLSLAADHSLGRAIELRELAL